MGKLLMSALLAFTLVGDIHANDPDNFLRAAKPVKNQYLVVLKDVPKDEVPARAIELANLHGGSVRRIMNNAASVFSINLTEAQALQLSKHPLVQSVEENGEVFLSAVQPLPTGPGGTLSNFGGKWNLDRIDQTSPVPNQKYEYCEKAASVTAYVIDTGVLQNHTEFLKTDGTSRVKRGVCLSMDCEGIEPGEPCGRLSREDPLQLNDLAVGHGTAVASILGGKNVGVAKDVTIVPLRVTSCPGDKSTTENVCWAFDWIRSSK